MRAWQPCSRPSAVGFCVYIRCCGNGGLWFRPYGESLLSNATKGTKKSRPFRTAPRLGSVFLRSGIHPGASPPVCFATTSSRRVRLRRTALRAHPRINASTQPAEGAGGSRSKAAGELTLGLWSGEERGGTRNRLAGWRPDCRPVSRRYAQESVGAGLLAMASEHPTNLSTCTHSNCGSRLAGDGVLTTNQSLQDTPHPPYS